MSLFIKSPIISLDVYDVKTPKGKLTKVNGRDFYSITYRKQGEVKININQKTLVSKEGCITLTPKNTDYTTEVVKDTHMIAIHFDCVHSSPFTEPFVYENTNHKIQNLFDKIFEKYLPDGTNYYECYSLFYSLIAEIEKHYITKQNSRIIPAILKAKSEIESNFRNCDFNIDSLVESLDISASYLRREFKKAYLVSPIEYLKNIRLQNAISMLSADYYSIGELATKCGYSGASYFIQSFKKSMGVSPKEYKKVISSRQAQLWSNKE